MTQHNAASTLTTLSNIVEKYQGQTTVNLGDLTQALNDRSIGILLLLLALPNCFPTLPGESTLLSLPIIILGSRLMFGSHSLWLPQKLKQKNIAFATLKKTISTAQPFFQKIETLIKPRLSFLHSPIARRIAGFNFFLQGFLLFLPIPFGNLVPGLSIALLALSLLEKDGVLYIVGMLVGLMAFFAMNAAIGVAWYGFESTLAAIGTDIQHIGAAIQDFIKRK